jgi:CHAT domain-containing protein
MKLAYEFNAMLADPGALNSKFELFRNTAGALYAMIFGGVNIPAGRIIISPDGPNIPYEALIVSKNNEPVKYLVQDYATSYTYSAQFLESTAGPSEKNSHGDFFGLAPILFKSSFQLVPLLGSDKSLERINRLFRTSTMITGKDVTPQRFMDEFYRYRVVQLYTHASDSGKYREPVIYFGDSSLNLSDLVHEERPFTRLMVLSACETASGKFYQGEGVFSFSRGIAALGIPSSISNIWSVENESTYRLTELFYTYLAEGLPLDIALQKAKLEFLKTASREKQLPYFWAAQILSGRSDPVPIKKPLPVAIILAGIGACLLVILMAWKRSAGKKSIQARDKAGIAS